MSKVEMETKAISYRQKKSNFFDFKELVENSDDKEIKGNMVKSVIKGEEKSKLPKNLRIITNSSFTHNDAFLQSQPDDFEQARKDQNLTKSDEDLAKVSLHQYYKKMSINPKLTNYLKSMMR
jgi:hypothetical protein